MLVDLNLFGLMTYWGMDLNTISVINLVLAVGLAVDYSAHIGHAYLTIQVADNLSNFEKRRIKAEGALG